MGGRAYNSHHLNLYLFCLLDMPLEWTWDLFLGTISIVHLAMNTDLPVILLSFPSTGTGYFQGWTTNKIEFSNTKVTGTSKDIGDLIYTCCTTNLCNDVGFRDELRSPPYYNTQH